MYSSRYFLLLFVTAALPRLFVSDVNITLTPDHVDEGYTETFTATCSSSLTLGTLVRLTLSRANDSSAAFKDLAFLNEMSSNPSVTAPTTTENFTATGNYNLSGPSQLQVEWKHPTEVQKGVYKCTAAGLDNLGHIYQEDDAKILAVVTQGPNQILDKIKQMDAMLKSFDAKMAEMENRMFDLVTNVTTMSDENRANTEQLDHLKSMFFVDSITFNNSEYFLSRDNFGSANVSATICAIYGGYLVEFDGPDEFEAVKNFIQNFTEFYYVYVGGSDLKHKDQWTYESTGQNMTWSNWYPSEPDSDPADAHCIKIYQIFDWEMVDTECFSHDIEYRFICEVPLTKALAG
ncbi:unnamed protein product [Lymnaea stagnalis]|uniref:C-type lectin domain-containing protein n=1 Tax=Lymnaea stagnalis TaxID=6523 RepID=A0AAV2I572_LYMST